MAAEENCLQCHPSQSGPYVFEHEASREGCVVCHNPAVTDSGVRPAASKPDESINFKTLIHKIHTGSDLTTDFTVIGHGGSVNNYNEVGYVGDRRDCTQCHLAGTMNLPLADGLIDQTAPRDYLNPLPPVSGACLSCHTAKSAAAHANIMTDPKLGESCDACHGTTSAASVANVHAR